MDTVIGKETYGSQPVRKKYLRTTAGTLAVVDESKKFTSISQFFRSVFLPQGFPESVSPDYVPYQLWDTLQAFCSSITGALATQAVLKGVGVGDESATVLAATITWMMKNGTGMVGQILFAWMKGSYLDCDCKRWRLFADILNDAAIFLEILAPFFLTYFRFIVCVAGVFKSIVGVAGGATRAALTQHQARRNNMADVSAKDGSQETLVNLSGLLVSLVLIPLVTGRQGVIWTLFMLFTCLHLFANYSAVTSVAMETFNLARLHIVCQHYFSSPDRRVMKVSAGNRREPVLWSTKRRLKVYIGTSLGQILNSFDDFQKFSALYSHSKYLLNIDLKRSVIHIVLHEDSDMGDQLEAAFQMEVLEYAVRAMHQNDHESYPTLQMQNIVEAARHGDRLSMLAHSMKLTQSTFPAFKEASEQQGWTTSHVLFGAEEWRATWDPRGIEDKKTF